MRLAGPEDDALVPIDEDEWEGDVDEMEESLDDGWEPPPLLAEYQDGRLLLQDGNHRYEALRARGRAATRGCSCTSTIPPTAIALRPSDACDHESR